MEGKEAIDKENRTEQAETRPGQARQARRGEAKAKARKD